MNVLAPNLSKFQVQFLLTVSFVFSSKVLKAPDITTQVKLSDSANTSPSFNSMKMRKRSSKTSLPHVVHSSRSSLHMFPIISGLVDKQNLEIGKDTRTNHGIKLHKKLKLTIYFPVIEYGTLRDGSLQSCYSSNNSLDRPWSPTPKDDLYSWMAKQHKERKLSVNKENAGSVIVSRAQLNSKNQLKYLKLTSHSIYFRRRNEQ